VASTYQIVICHIIVGGGGQISNFLSSLKVAAYCYRHHALFILCHEQQLAAQTDTHIKSCSKSSLNFTPSLLS
jgi:hypothetical protein